MRVNVWIPDELHHAIKGLGQVNVSKVLQEALRDLLGCRHDQLACAACAAPIDHQELIDDAVGRFYSDALWDLDPLVRRAGTAEGAARILREVAQRWRVPAAKRIPLPRPTRANREAARARADEAQYLDLTQGLPGGSILNEEVAT